MKVFVFSCKDDERKLFEDYEKHSSMQFGYCSEQPKMENADLAEGYPCITIVGTKISEELLDKLYSVGVRCICARCIGIDHIPLAHAKELGIRVSNITYSPNSVADFAALLMLMCLRKAKYILQRYSVHDYSLDCVKGRELRDMTVGFVGGGRIGLTVMKQISGFGCKMLVYDCFQNDEVKKYAEYVDYETLLKNSDIVSYHTPGTKETYHMLNTDNVKLLKKGAIVINTSRGTNVDTKALIYGLENGIISAAGLDVVDNEPTIYNIDHKTNLLKDHDVAVLESYPNVIITPHVAFSTDHSERDMVENAIKNAEAYFAGKDMPWEIKM